MIKKSMGTTKRMLISPLGLLLGLGLAAETPAQDSSGADALPSCITAANWSADAIPGQDLWSSGGPGGVYAAVKTNAGNSALLSLSALDTLVIESLTLFSAEGVLISRKEYLSVPAGSTFDLDTGVVSSDRVADVKWNTGPKSLEPVNDAMFYSCR